MYIIIGAEASNHARMNLSEATDLISKCYTNKCEVQLWAEKMKKR